MEEDIVVELGMTTSQLHTMKWILVCWLGKYNYNESSVYKEDAQAIYNALKGLV